MQRFSAVIFDMDGVITDTAVVHRAAWKKMFDPFLKEYAALSGSDPLPFDAGDDYLKFVDGKSRYEGVASFLESRGINLDHGNEDDPPDKETVCGLGNRKELIFRELLSADGVKVFESTLKFINILKEKGIVTAVASSSRNCRTVLESAGILNLFEAVVDGRDLASEGLKSKPAPDIFLKAAGDAGVSAGDAAVVEDAVSGVAAGVSGGFGFVIGIDREGDGAALKEAGADIVVPDLSSLVYSFPESGVLSIDGMRNYPERLPF